MGKTHMGSYIYVSRKNWGSVLYLTTQNFHMSHAGIKIIHNFTDNSYS